jgi:glutathione S-transferase
MYYLASTMHVAHAHRMRGSRWADQQSSFDDMTAKVPQTMRACAEYVEENAFLGDFVAGEELTIADPYLFIVCNWLSGDGVAIDDLPRLSAFMDRMNDRESVRIVRGKDML